ncbi:31942_t:CDS:2 [Gigaspora margarita]|uniref:31942_t:CDS:1 n=1 Tax=Gigaspora margarita TaxID=4874 RepID=A0ABM8VZJ4_GIGMA|nr:31942_t:CDS:2 [Gigaspora margarita]
MLPSHVLTHDALCKKQAQSLLTFHIIKKKKYIPGFPEGEYVSNSTSSRAGEYCCQFFRGEYMSNVAGSLAEYMEGDNVSKGEYVSNIVGEYAFILTGSSNKEDIFTVAGSLREYMFAAAEEKYVSNATDSLKKSLTVNLCNKIREVSQAENERIKRNILNLSNNINRIHETIQIENEKIERNIADLNNNFNRIHETSKLKMNESKEL